MVEQSKRVTHLVLDAGPLIDHASVIPSLAERFYAPQDVMGELRDEKTRRAVAMLPCEIVVREPSQEALKEAAEGAKRTGDFKSLSLVDLKVIALTIDLHREYARRVEAASAAGGGEGMEVDGEEQPKGEEAKEKAKKERPSNLPDGFCADAVDSDDDEGWITEDNVEDANGMNIELDERPTVACLTTDFAVQNVLLAMHLELVSLSGKRIARINSYVQRCRACYDVTKDKEREFCSKCGNKTLHKCAITIDADGTEHLHINYRRLAVTRGLRYSMAAPVGGKRSMPQKLFEDQPMPHIRPARVRGEKACDAEFALHDVTSRSAALGVRTAANQARRQGNVNARGPPGKRRGGKR